MSDVHDAIEIALQILFGLLGILFAIAAIHYRDSLGGTFFHRYRERPIQYFELEAGIIEVEDRRHGIGGCSDVGHRSGSLPPDYDHVDLEVDGKASTKPETDDMAGTRS
ncbi:hypothetical protein CC86DRAFT_462214 [Ophiobolus disseminans]|uniref:Uncharacterized protein n=1 Tax=Ophiobolus disseminans TaxID=1469910 RepID=A0A6A7AL36_9PLEO|nr:hypothetical protein CC86DRAFT_462214 [Ophiobolus disseminans]